MTVKRARKLLPRRPSIPGLMGWTTAVTSSTSASPTRTDASLMIRPVVRPPTTCMVTDSAWGPGSIPRAVANSGEITQELAPVSTTSSTVEGRIGLLPA